MPGRSPLETVEMVDEAFNAGDLGGVLACYEPDAVMVVEPGRVAWGQAELRRAFEFILAGKPRIINDRAQVTAQGDLALFLSHWNLDTHAPDGSAIRLSGHATSVLRRQADGSWLIAIDNAWGPAILG